MHVCFEATAPVCGAFFGISKQPRLLPVTQAGVNEVQVPIQRKACRDSACECIRAGTYERLIGSVVMQRDRVCRKLCTCILLGHSMQCFCCLCCNVAVWPQEAHFRLCQTPAVPFNGRTLYENICTSMRDSQLNMPAGAVPLNCTFD